MGQKFDKLSKPEQAAVMTWAKHEAIMHSGSVIYSGSAKEFGDKERAAYAEEQAEKVAADPARVKRIVDAVNSKACQDGHDTYVLRGASQAEKKQIDWAVDMGVGKLPDFVKNARSCTAEDIQLSSRGIPKETVSKTR